MQLGIILAPYGKIPGAYPSEIAYSYGGDGTYLCPDDDPFYNTRGEIGFFHDTQLGAPRKMGFFERIRARMQAKSLGLPGLGSYPSNFDLEPTYGWVPMIDPIVASREGYTVGTWIPPNGYQPGPYQPLNTKGMHGLAGLGFLGDDSPVLTVPVPTITPSPDAQAAANAAAAAIDATLQAHQDRMFKLTIISTTIVGLSALLATLRTWRQLKRDEQLFLSRS